MVQLSRICRYCSPPPTWLARERTYGILGVDENTANFYSKDNYAAIIGNKDFKAWIYDESFPELALEQKSRLIHPDIKVIEVTEGVARFYHCSMSRLITDARGKGKNEPRKIAMHWCQELTAAKSSTLK